MTVNINQATKEELMDIPQMSEARAESILHYRENHGAFGSPKDLEKVPAIGATMAQQLGEYCNFDQIGGNKKSENKSNQSKDR